MSEAAFDNEVSRWLEAGIRHGCGGVMMMRPMQHRRWTG
jgi:hypothetical protein